MPVSLILALFLAFGTESILPPAPVPRGEVGARVAEVAGLVATAGLVAFAFALAVLIRLRLRGRPTQGVRRLYGAGSWAVEAICLGGYAYAVVGRNWTGVVRTGMGTGDTVLIDELLVILPFVLARLAGWWGFYPADRALRLARNPDRPATGVGRHLLLRARQALGMVLPASLLFALGQDLARVIWPARSADASFQLGLMAAMGALTLGLAPAFVRLSWPTRPLPAGPLRDRLERLAARFSFRYTDILIWETDGAVVNAGVTGALPWFRYVLLTDLLVESLDPHEVAAVFGHEVGHIRHRHLSFYGFFLVGSIGTLTLASEMVSDRMVGIVGGAAGMAIQAGLVLSVGVAYFAAVFGVLSRRFERQADVFGCRSVSCDRPDCPPHPDPYARPADAPLPAAGPLCPVGIRIFANALARVAALNGLDPTTRSWRHGSIAARIAFLERLEGKPRAERSFQWGVARLRIALAVALIAALILSYQTGAIEQLGP
ncbi:M48 family metallopeptidase [Tundrisphaera sp. TA3]|uniref:M48 family metallopeptidase n=1 Tax=Tundrisphaera sp. TA3 TaxID=3435775 RepID=UPI003EBAFA01